MKIKICCDKLKESPDKSPGYVGVIIDDTYTIVYHRYSKAFNIEYEVPETCQSHWDVAEIPIKYCPWCATILEVEE